MRIHLSVRKRAFTVLGNEVLRDRRLSFTARGILAYLLSLPDGAREDVRTLADKNPGLGRRGIAKALDELVALGYYVRRTVRDGDSGRVRTETYVFDTPQQPGAPLPAPAGTGERAVGNAGASPKGEKNRNEVPPTRPTPAASGRAGEGKADPTPPCTEAQAARGAALLHRLSVAEPKLALSAAEALALAPLAAPWLERGLSDPEIRSLLSSGLPPVVYSARAFLTDRLVRKLPAPRPRRDPAAPAAPLAECGECRDPLPRGRRSGLCVACAAAPVMLTVHGEARPAPPAGNGRVGSLRAAFRPRPAATVGAEGSASRLAGLVLGVERVMGIEPAL